MDKRLGTKGLKRDKSQEAEKGVKENFYQVPTIPCHAKYHGKYITNSVSFNAQQHQNTLLRL